VKCVIVNLRGGVRSTGTLGCANVFEPLGVLYLAAYVEAKTGVAVRVIHQLRESHDDILTQILEERADLVCFSVLTPTLDASLQMASAVKGASACTAIAFGGDHPSGDPSVIEDPSVDYVTVGEGEEALVGIVEAIQGRRELATIPSTRYKLDGRTHFNPERTPVDMNDLPHPLRKGSYLESSRVGGLMNPFMTSQKSVAVVAATRGCPFSCVFCNNELMWESRVRRRDPEDVVDEMGDLVDRFGTNTVFFTDLTFNASKRYAIDLCQALIRRSLPVQWYAMCNINVIDKEICSYMAEAKCGKIGFGVESFIPETMARGKGSIAKDFAFTNEKLALANESGIFTKAFLIIGFPWETQGMYDDLAQALHALEAHEVRIGYYVPFVGTAGYERDRALIDEWDLRRWSSLETPVVKNGNLTREAIVANQEYLYNAFYHSVAWRARVLSMAQRFPHLEPAVRAYMENV